MTSPHRARRATLTAIAGIAALALSACSGGGEVTGEDGRATLTIATVPTDSCAQGFIGDERGIFADHGLDVTLNVVAGVPELAAAVSSGQADLACSAPTAIAAGVSQGLPFTMIAPGIQYTEDNPGGDLVVPPGSAITNPNNLEGTTIAVNALNTLPHLSTMAMLDDLGIDPAGVNFVNLPFPNIAQAMETGQVQSGFLQSPFTENVQAAGGRILVSPYNYVNDGQPFVYTSWFGTQSFAQQNPAVVQNIREAFVEISTWANDPANAEDRRAILAGATGQSVDTLAQARTTQYGTELTAAEIQAQIDLQVRFGTLPEPINAADIIAPATAPTP